MTFHIFRACTRRALRRASRRANNFRLSAPPLGTREFIPLGCHPEWQWIGDCNLHLRVSSSFWTI